MRIVENITELYLKHVKQNTKIKEKELKQTQFVYRRKIYSHSLLLILNLIQSWSLKWTSTIWLAALTDSSNLFWI